MRWLLLGLPAGIYTLFAADNVIPPEGVSWIEGGVTVVVSGLLVLVVAKIMPAQQEKKDQAHDLAIKEQRDAHLEAQESSQKMFTEAINKMESRHDAWETQRHADSAALATVLRDLMINCTEARHGLQQGKPTV